MAPRALIALVFAGLLASFVVGCAPRVGDGCATATNCSINGDRSCDTASTGGACTIFDCQPDQCPDDAVCARFLPSMPRRSVVACMRRCSSDGDCRSGDGYRCIDPTTYEGGDFAQVIDQMRPNARFCVATTAATR